MSTVSRRQAFGVITAGAVAAATGASSANALPVRSLSTDPKPMPDWVRQLVSQAAQQTGREIALPPLGPVLAATVSYCRSWDSAVYLYVDDSMRGFVTLNAAAFQIAVAAQAADRQVAIRAWGHDRDWCDGAGRFEGALLAVDPRDLPLDLSMFGC